MKEMTKSEMRTIDGGRRKNDHERRAIIGWYYSTNHGRTWRWSLLRPAW